MEKHFIAYHGTSKENADSILTNGPRIKKYSFVKAELEQVPGDLGEGFYAFQDSYDNAHRFIAKSMDSDKIAILEMDLQVKADNFLDFDDPDNAKIMETHRTSQNIQNLRKRFRAAKGSKTRECLDGLIIEFALHKMNLTNKVDLISKKTYTPFDGMYKLSHFTNGIELCIKNEDIVKDIREKDL